MDNRRKRSEGDSQPSRKRQKQNSIGVTEIHSESSKDISTTDIVEHRPKSRKELRKERKSSQTDKKASGTSTPTSNTNNTTIHSASSTTVVQKRKAEPKATEIVSKGSSNPRTGEDIRRLAKAERLKERRRQLRKERKAAIETAIQERQEGQESLRHQNMIVKEGHDTVNSSNEKRQPNKKSATKAVETRKSKTKDPVSRHDQDFDYDVFSSVFHGSREDPDGYTSLRLGVKYKDIKVGKGSMVDGNNNLVNVKYKLTGGKFNTVLDSSSNFTFRVGKGEVIQGWDIGLVGMREGGSRKLIVPPKAGYGSQDIGAGSG